VVCVDEKREGVGGIGHMTLCQSGPCQLGKEGNVEGVQEGGSVHSVWGWM